MRKTIFRVVAGAIFLAILAAVCLVGTSLSPYRLGIVQTGSMTPALPSRSLIVIKVHDFRVGEPIAFHQHNQVITHRLIGVNADGTLSTKGDANASADSWNLNKADVIGGVRGSVPELGFWFAYFQNPWGIGSLVFSLLSVWLLWPLVRKSSSDTDDDASLVQAS